MPHDPAIDPTGLLQLEERVAAIFELPDTAQAAAFAKLRQRYPRHANLLLRWERAALAIEASQRTMQSVSAAVGRRPTPAVPARIGAYKILDVLGEGGMGVVYLAEQQTPVRRRVALKLVHAGADKRDVLLRFAAERQALAMMAHPNIAKVLDAGETDEGLPFFALEHVPGLPITDYCDRQRLGVRERIELFQKVCHGVQHAHQKGVIHRDLKPSNILVQVRDGYAAPKIIDFGVAKALQQRLTDRTLYTEQGRLLGTPEYMSPEQAEMSGLDIDTRSDIYSLGVLLYELLAGALPFEPIALRRAGYLEMQRAIREDEPERPSTRCSTLGADAAKIAMRRRTNPRALAKALDGDLDWIVLRCLEKDPSRRYPAASELAADLQRHLDDEPVLAGPPSLAYRLRKVLRKHRALVASAAAISAAMAGGLLVALWQYREAEASARAAHDNEQRALRAEGAARDHLQRAERALTRSQALNVAAASARVLARDPITALLLALKAVELDRNPETLSQVQSAFAEQYLYAEFRGPEGALVAADFDPGRRRVLTGSADGTVRVWSEDGDPLLSLDQGGSVVAAEFSDQGDRILTIASRGPHQVARAYAPDGRPLAEIGAAGDAALHRADWDPATMRLLVHRAEPPAVAIVDASGAELRVLASATNSNPRERLLFSPQGHAVRMVPGRAWIWPADGGAAVTLQAPEGGWFHGGVDRIAFDPRRELIATTHSDFAARLWTWTGELAGELRGHRASVEGVRFSPSGDAVLTASTDGTAQWWDRAGRPGATASAGGSVTRARFFGSHRRVLSSGVSRLTLFNERGRAVVSVGGRDQIEDALPDEGVVLTSEDTVARLWRLGGVEGQHLRSDGERPWFPALHPGGELLVGSEDGRVFAWDGDGNLVREFDAGTGRAVYGIASSLDGARLAAGTYGAIQVWDWRTGEPVALARHGPPRSPFSFLYFLPDARLWAHQQSSQSRLLDLEQGTAELVFDRRRDAMHGFYWLARAAPDRSMFALIGRRAGTTCPVVLFDAQGARVADFRPHELYTNDIAWQPKGSLMATSSADGTVRLWDRAEVLADPEAVAPRRTIPVETPPILVAFSPDGSRLLIVTANRAYVTDLDGTVCFHFWPREDPEEGLTPAHFFSADGRWIVGEAYDGARRWPAREEDLLRLARKWAERLRGDRDLAEFTELWQRGAAARTEPAGR